MVRLTSRVKKARKRLRRGLWRAVSDGQLFKKAIFSIRDQDRAAGAETGCFWDSQNELRCKNNGIGEETARRARKRGDLGIHKTNYVVKTTELERKPRGGRGKGVFWGFTKRIPLLKQRNSRRDRAAGWWNRRGILNFED